MPPDESGPPDERIDDIRALLTSLDHPVPVVSAAAIARAARARAETRGDRRHTAVRWAAAVVLTLGAAGVAVAAPGSPVRGWIARLAAAIGGGHQVVAPQHPPRTSAPSEEPAGIAVAPGDGLTIVFTAPEGTVISASFGVADHVLVRARAGAAHFAAEPDRLLVDVAGAPDTIALEIPRSAPRVEFRAGGTRFLLVEHGRLRPAVAPDPRGRFLIPLPSTAR